MRWNNPRRNDTRIKSGFLLFPKTLDKETRWLEHAYWLEIYELIGYNVYGESLFRWREKAWTTSDDVVEAVSTFFQRRKR
jgi:hypothetical protein